MVALIFAQTFVRGCLNVLIVVAAFEILDGGGEAVGYMTAAIGVGGLIGGLGAMTLGGKRLAVSFGVALVLWGLPLVFIGPWPELALAVGLLAVVGAANSVEDVAGFTLLQRLVPDQFLTRVLGVTWSIAMGGVALGSIAAPLLVEALGPRTAFVAVGLVLPLSALAAYRRLAETDDAVAPAPELELVEQVPMFGPLSVAAKERVAANLIPLSAQAGDVVIRAGEVGDRFYIVGQGELEVSAEGLEKRISRRGVLRRDRLAPGCAADGDGHGAGRQPPVCPPARGLPRGGDGTRGRPRRRPRRRRAAAGRHGEEPARERGV